MKTRIFNFSEQVTTITCNGRFLAIGFCDGTIEIQEFQSDAFVLMRSWKGHWRFISGLIFLSDEGLVSGSYDGSVKRWDLETGRDELSTPKEQWVRYYDNRSVRSLAELTGGRVAAGCDDGTVRLLDLGTGLSPSQGGVCRGHTHWVSTVISLGVVGDRAGSFASSSGDKTIRVWTTSPIGGANDGFPRQVVEVESPVRSLSLSPTSSPWMVAAGCFDGSVRLFRIPKWDSVWKDGSVKVHTDWVCSVSFSPDGRFLASASDDRLVKILSSETGAVLRTFKGHTSWVKSVFFSQDGFSILSGSDDKTVRVWRLVEQDDRIASLLIGRTPSDLVYQGEDVFKQLFTTIRTKLI